MSQNKKHKPCTFSKAPSYYSKKRRAKFEKRQREAEAEYRMIEKMANGVDAMIGPLIGR